MTNRPQANLKNEIERLAEEAFHRHLISGYGNGESSNEYQIIYEGKPRHFSLEYARNFLRQLINHKQPPHLMHLNHHLDFN
ncbi:hypothetical protein H6F87_18435 [Cyanobacteria bacterium FACHB-502]|nr:hypothetical protein [Cyanobacteria bacterium FACHB-502]MBD2026727.1 hypothetical protein [Leptolyngbya sp. FACHB-711]